MQDKLSKVAALTLRHCAHSADSEGIEFWMLFLPNNATDVTLMLHLINANDDQHATVQVEAIWRTSGTNYDTFNQTFRVNVRDNIAVKFSI